MKLHSFLIIINLIILLVFPGGYACGQNVSISPVIQKENGSEFYLHTVQPGETLFRIAKTYQVTVDDITKHNPAVATGLKPLQELKIPRKSSVQNNQHSDNNSGFIYHIVQQDETLESIGAIYSVNSKRILNMNPGIITPLQKDQILKIPMDYTGGEVVVPNKSTSNQVAFHVVKPKETLFGISRQYGLSIIDLLTLNPKAENGLKQGDTLSLISQKTETLSEKSPGGQSPEISDNLAMSLNADGKGIGENDTLHEVKKKETWYGISRKYGLTVDELQALNPDKRTLVPGDFLVVKKKSGEAATVPQRVDSAVQETIQANSVVTVKEVESMPAKVLTHNDFTVALLMPFEVGDNDSANQEFGRSAKDRQQEFKFLSFYEGLLVAADSLNRMGLSVKLLAYDIPKGSGRLQSVLEKPELKRVDLIIGLVYANDFVKLSKFSDENQIPLINPLTRRRESAENPWVIKIQPDVGSQMLNIKNLMAASEKKHDFFISRQNKYQLGNEAREASNMIYGLKIEKPDLVASIKTVTDSVLHLKRLLESASNPVVFTFADNPAYVMDYMRKLSQGNDDFSITAIFGLPDWNSMEKLETSQLESLNIHMLKALYPRYQHHSVKKFVANFHLRFYADPDELACTGFDVLWITGHAFRNSNHGIIEYLLNHPIDGILARYSFAKVNGKGVENQFWNIYKIEDYQLRIVNR